jgi:acyl dehydratase
MAGTARLSTSIDELPSVKGRCFGPSSWRTVTQDDIDDFARVSGDHNPVHVDPAFAAATPYGTTIAHGLLTLSLVVPLLDEIFEVTGAGLGINYGLNRLRFPAPVPAGSRIRVVAEITEVTEVTGGFQVLVPVTWEIESAAKPAAAAELVLRYYR